MSEPTYHFIPQYELEWVRLHLGRPSASQFHRFMDTSFNLRKGDMVKTYIYEKCAEKFRNQALPGFTSYETEQGEILEYEAREYFQLETGHQVRRIGFVESADNRCGCSPDGLIDDNAGVEIKSPQKVNAICYLIEDKLPNDYVQQVYGNLYVTQREWWAFYSYSRGLPTLLKKITSDDKIMSKIDNTMKEFYEVFDETYSKLKALKP